MNKKDFEKTLTELLILAQQEKAPYIEIKSGDLHRQVGGYPSQNHRMPTCCLVMKREMKTGDKILHQPSKGKGATLVIRYQLPR